VSGIPLGQRSCGRSRSGVVQPREGGQIRFRISAARALPKTPCHSRTSVETRRSCAGRAGIAPQPDMDVVARAQWARRADQIEQSSRSGPYGRERRHDGRREGATYGLAIPPTGDHALELDKGQGAVTTEFEPSPLALGPKSPKPSDSISSLSRVPEASSSNKSSGVNAAPTPARTRCCASAPTLDFPLRPSTQRRAERRGFAFESIGRHRNFDSAGARTRFGSTWGAWPTTAIPGYVIIQHIARGSLGSMAERLPNATTSRGPWGRAGRPSGSWNRPGRARRHTNCNCRPMGLVQLIQGPVCHGVRPSVDVALSQLPQPLQRVIAAVLTGMGEEGEDGANRIRAGTGIVTRRRGDLRLSAYAARGYPNAGEPTIARLEDVARGSRRRRAAIVHHNGADHTREGHPRSTSSQAKRSLRRFRSLPSHRVTNYGLDLPSYRCPDAPPHERDGRSPRANVRRVCPAARTETADRRQEVATS